ncbi:hypothetical protein BH10PSE19_BH10PSE19_15370 [soil metagenome]
MENAIIIYQYQGSKNMLKAIEAIVNEQGQVRLLENIKLVGTHRAVVTILDDVVEEKNFSAHLSETALAKDWNRPEEDDAWKHLQLGQ